MALRALRDTPVGREKHALDRLRVRWRRERHDGGKEGEDAARVQRGGKERLRCGRALEPLVDEVVVAVELPLLGEDRVEAVVAGDLHDL